MKKTVIQIIEYSTKKVVKEVDVTGKPERHIDIVDSGMNRNLDHKNYYTLIK